ncbi:MAG: hypothetical protein Q4F12_02145 [Erysipelotrichaceae bacterium]|nr:hypothetical protein [Erysipelotrichaceae bacterium]
MEKLDFFAVVRSYSDTCSYHNYVVNDLEGLKTLLIDECENCFAIEPSWELEDFENEYYCEFDNYKQLKENNDIEDISNFSFVLSDMGCCIDLYSNNINEIQQYLDSKGFDIEKLTDDNAVSVLKGLIK